MGNGKSFLRSLGSRSYYLPILNPRKTDTDSVSDALERKSASRGKECGFQQQMLYLPRVANHRESTPVVGMSEVFVRKLSYLWG